LAIAGGQWLLLTWLAAAAGLSRSLAVRCFAALAALLLAAGGVHLRGPLADDGIGLKQVLHAVDFRRQFAAERLALWIVVQWGIAGAITSACFLFATATRGKKAGRRRRAGIGLALLLAALVAPLVFLFLGLRRG
jgi:hypothetical protein